MLCNYTLAPSERTNHLPFNETSPLLFSSSEATRCHAPPSQIGQEADELGCKIIAIRASASSLFAVAALVRRIGVRILEALSRSIAAIHSSRSFDFNSHIGLIISKSEGKTPLLLKREKMEGGAPPFFSLEDQPQLENSSLFGHSEQLIDSSFPEEEKNEKASLEKKTPEERMLNNLFKAFQEHAVDRPPPSVDCLFASKKKLPSLSFIAYECAKQGMRSNMEDGHFYAKIKDGCLLGVFDGHGDRGEIAQYAIWRCPLLFSEERAKFPDDMIALFSAVIERIHQEVIDRKIGVEGGCTAVICFVNERTHAIYTATLGDSEAKIYRKDEEGIYAIPLSCVRDWSSKKDAARAAAALQNPTIAEKWPLVSNPKLLRFYANESSLNVSRAIGDQVFNQINGKPVVIQKPKVTVCELQEGDLLVLACDGVWDYMGKKEREFIKEVLEPNWQDRDEEVAQAIVDHAINRLGSQDNVSVVALMC